MVKLGQQIRVDGKIMNLYDLYDVLMEDATQPLHRKGQSKRFYTLVDKLNNQGWGETRKVDGTLLYVDTYVGTEKEYELHYLLKQMDSMGIDTQLYKLHEQRVNELLKVI